MRETLQKRRELLETKVLPKLTEPSGTRRRLSRPAELVQSVKAQGFEGLVAKRRDSVYESGLRSGAWMKMRVNHGQEFVIGGYTRGTKTFDALSSATTRATVDLRRADAQRFHARPRAQLFRKFGRSRPTSARSPTCPRRGAADGAGADEGEDGGVPWLKPVLVGQFEFLEWTGENHLRHSKFVALREDKKARDVARE